MAMHEQDLTFDSGLAESIEFPEDSQLLSSSDIASTASSSINSSLRHQHITSIKRDESSLAASSFLHSGNEIHSFIHSTNEHLNVNEYRDEIGRDNGLHFLASDSAFQVPINSSNGNTSCSVLPQSLPSGYPAINANQNYSYQPPVQFPHVPVVNSNSNLGQVLTRNNEQNTVPDFLNSFLRYQNGPTPPPTISVCDNAYDEKNLRGSKSHRLNKRQDMKQNKGRGEGNKLLSTRATQILEGWYETNTEWPYPSKAEKQMMASAGGITIEQVNSWFANRRNRSQNTRPKKNMIKLVNALSGLCDEYQEASHGIISSSDMKNRILALINYHLQRRQ
ncbi:Homeobox protein knotted-1-like 3 [Taenia crassiceps]|uniref:Homeobox protein knotted-1-like 3 n=1 Tax=Taenia crassiceps TaxID=6207 RepID=A0ABR4QMA0_9CEST